MHFLIRFIFFNYSSYAWQMRCIFIFWSPSCLPKHRRINILCLNSPASPAGSPPSPEKPCAVFFIITSNFTEKKQAYCNISFFFFPSSIAQLYCTESVCVYILRLLASRYMRETVWAPLVNTPHRVSPELSEWDTFLCLYETTDSCRRLTNQKTSCERRNWLASAGPVWPH